MSESLARGGARAKDLRGLRQRREGNLCGQYDVPSNSNDSNERI